VDKSVRPRHDRDGSPQRNQIIECGTSEKNLVVVIRGQFGAAVTIARQPKPAHRVEDSLDQLTLKHTVRQSGGTSAAAGKREQKECVRVVRWTSIACHQLCDAVAGMQFDTVDRNVDGRNGRAAAKHYRGQDGALHESGQPSAHRPTSGEYSDLVGDRRTILTVIVLRSIGERHSSPDRGRLFDPSLVRRLARP